MKKEDSLIKERSKQAGDCFLYLSACLSRGLSAKRKHLHAIIKYSTLYHLVKYFGGRYTKKEVKWWKEDSVVEKRIWRPKGWVTPKAEFHPLHCLAADACVGKSYEDGADAMLESLKLQEGSLFLVGAQNATDDTKLKICIENRQGWLIFIPINKQASEIIEKISSYTSGDYAIEEIKRGIRNEKNKRNARR